MIVTPKNEDACASADALPLAGIKVVEICHSIAGPYGGSILAQLGADVLKVESPGKGDDARAWAPPFLQGTSSIFQAMNRDKRGIQLNLKNPGDCAYLRALIRNEADVVLQSLRPGAVERLGLGADDLLKEKPSLIYANLGAFGTKGPLKNEPGYDPLMQARSGLMSLTGEDGREPVRIGTSIIDMGTGMWLALGVLAALHRRSVTGKGCVVDTSLFETSLAWMTIHIAGYLASGEVRARMGSGVKEIVPHQAFATSDGYVMVAAGNDNLFPKLAALLGHPEWILDARFSGNVERVQNRLALIPLIQDILVRRPTSEWLTKLAAAGGPCSPLQTVDQVVADPQALATGMIQTSPGGDMQLVGLPLSFDGRRTSFRSEAPTIDQGNDRMPRAYVAQ
jgi:crotonobetainyl-CoA:carnitine CoA-transferase CaiB-like acyl-CoA transferase